MAISALYNSGDFDSFGDNFGSIEDIMSTAPSHRTSCLDENGSMCNAERKERP